jgi:hypothetical protein
LEGLIENPTGGHVSEVKVVLTTVVALLGIYQVGLIAVAYEKVRLPFLTSAAAGAAHRAIGDAIVALTLFISFLCVGYFGLEAEELDAHVPLALGLLIALGLKVIVVRWARRAQFLLPSLGLAVLSLLVAIWLNAAAHYLA